MNLTNCRYENQCSGCQYLAVPYQQQTQIKIEQLNSLLLNEKITPPPISFMDCGQSQIRTRLDFSYQEGRMGLYQSGTKKIVDIEECSQLSADLNSLLKKFRSINWPQAIKKASIRLRVGPQNQYGIWLDMAHSDFKILFDEKIFFSQLLELGTVEIGQRRKILYHDFTENRFRLKDPVCHIWFQTWIQDSTQDSTQPESLVAFDLYSQVASFTQPGPKSNKLMIQTLIEWQKSLQIKNLIEFGSGIGNLTLPFLSLGTNILAIEKDHLALEALKLNYAQWIKKFGRTKSQLIITNIRNQIENQIQDQITPSELRASQCDAILVNPPRSGLGNFLDQIWQLNSDNIKSFLYVACNPETFAKDALRIIDKNFHLDQVRILDQFPQTTHYEVMALFSK